MFYLLASAINNSPKMKIKAHPLKPKYFQICSLSRETHMAILSNHLQSVYIFDKQGNS